jgi:MFS transporter, OPA family, glycerol-3-phosphate transporter
MLLGTLLCYLFFYTGRHNFGWAAKQLAEELGVNFAKIGWISFSMLIGYAVGQLINGNLADRIDPKKMMITGGLLSVMTNFLISFSSDFWVILILWCCNGYFQSMAWAPGSRIISNWWPSSKRGLAFGFFTMSAASSSIVTYFISILLVGESWRYLFRIPVLFLVVAIIAFYFIVKSKPDNPIEASLEPKDAGSAKPYWKEAYQIALGNPKFLIACLSIGFQNMARYGLIFWLPLYFLGDNYKSNKELVWLSLLLPFGMAVGAFSFGYISDRFFAAHRVWSISIGMFLCSAISFCIFILPTGMHAFMGVFIFFAGFFVYGPQANFWPLSPELLGHKYVGTGVGLMNMTGYVFAALGEPLMGKVLDITGDKAMIFLVVAIIALLSSLTILMTSIKMRDKKYMKKLYSTNR